MTDAEFLAKLAAKARRYRLQLARDDYLTLLRLAGFADTDAFRQAALDQRESFGLDGHSVRQLLELAQQP